MVKTKKKEKVKEEVKEEVEEEFYEHITPHGKKKMRKKVVVDPPPFEWLEADIEDEDLELLHEFSGIYQPEDIGMDFMLQLIARGSTIETAKKEWRKLHKNLKDEASFINEMKKH